MSFIDPEKIPVFLLKKFQYLNELNIKIHEILEKKNGT